MANKRTKHAALDKKRNAAKDSAKKNRTAAVRSKNRDLQDNLDQRLQSIHAMHSFVDNPPVEPPKGASAVDATNHIAQLTGRLEGL